MPFFVYQSVLYDTRKCKLYLHSVHLQYVQYDSTHDSRKYDLLAVEHVIYFDQSLSCTILGWQDCFSGTTARPTCTNHLVYFIEMCWFVYLCLNFSSEVNYVRFLNLPSVIRHQNDIQTPSSRISRCTFDQRNNIFKLVSCQRLSMVAEISLVKRYGSEKAGKSRMNGFAA